MERITIVGLCLTVLVASAEARSLPRAEPPAKMETCDGTGPGFFKIQGSDTCVKLSGSARVEVGKQSGSSTFIPNQR